MKTRIILSLALLSLLLLRCQEPDDPIIVAVEEAESILRSNEWQVRDFIVTVANEDLPPPFLAGVAGDELLQPGEYNSAQIFGELDNVNAYRIRFNETNKILIHSTGNGDFVESGTYKIFSSNDIRLGIADQQKLRYDYLYISSERTMTFGADQGTAGLVIDRCNERITKLVVNETPNKIGDAVARLLFENERIQEALNVPVGSDQWQTCNLSTKLTRKYWPIHWPLRSLMRWSKLIGRENYRMHSKLSSTRSPVSMRR